MPPQPKFQIEGPQEVLAPVGDDRHILDRDRELHPGPVTHRSQQPGHVAEQLFEAASHPNKTLHVYPGVLHEPHNDLGHEQLATDVADTLWPRLAMAPTR